MRAGGKRIPEYARKPMGVARNVTIKQGTTHRCEVSMIVAGPSELASGPEQERLDFVQMLLAHQTLHCLRESGLEK